MSDLDLDELPSVVLSRPRLIDTGETSRGFQPEKPVKIDLDAVLVPAGRSLGQTAQSVRPRSKWPSRERHSRMPPVVGHVDIYHAIQQAVIQQSTEAEIDRVVCESLVESGRYATAAISTVSLATEEIDFRAIEGGSRALGGGASQATDGKVDVFGEATLAAASSGETQIVHVGSDDDQVEALPGVTRGEDDCWIIAIPVTFEGTRYGVLTVCAARGDGFTDHDQAALEELALTVGHALNAARWKQAFVGETCIELDVWLPDLFDTLGQSADQQGGDATVTVEEMVPVGTSRVIQHLTVTGHSQVDFRETMAKMDEVESVRQLDSDCDRSRFEVIYNDFPLMSTLVSYGGSIKDVHYHGSDLHVTVVLPSTVDVRQLIEALQSDVPEFKLGAQRTVHRSQTTTTPFQDGLEDLTARQQTTVLTALVGGYFEWPRESTAEEIATTMDISSPTFHYHLRLAQNKILSRLLERDQSVSQ